ncbi:MAG: hypothetical protein OEV00_03475 [Acidobacteriota bacterium]|nr:hypothetical protein [Acidobacteriota bacterium]MDH3784371.1 hypothetical protein [Acidobacteriota bacterium]
MSLSRSAVKATAVCALFLIATLPSGQPVMGQEAETTDEQSRILSRERFGEEEQIRRREEWFFSSRRAGTDSAAERATLRLEAVEDVRQKLNQQQRRRSDGRGPVENFWIEMGPSPSTFGSWAFGTVTGRVTAIAKDWTSNTHYVGTAAGGLWKTTNDGASYTHMFDTVGTLTVGAVAVDALDPNIVWVGTGDYNAGCESYFGIGMLRSDDGGTSWDVRNGSGSNTLDDMANFSSISIDPANSLNVIAGGDRRGCADGSSQAGGIYTTSDGGLNWDQRLSTSVHGLQRDAGNSDIVWAATDSGIYKSTDNGLNWNLQSANGLPTNPGRCEVAVAPSDGNVVYAQFTSSIWRTADGGVSWSQVSAGSSACDGQCSYNMTIGVDPTNPDIVYRGNIRLFKSTNGGLNWNDLINGWGGAQKVHQDVHELLVSPTDTNVFYVGSDGGLWKSTNGGTSFSNKNGNINSTQFYAIDVDAANPGNICGGAQDNSSLARSGSNTWSRQAVTGDGFVCQYNSVQTNYHYITSYPSGGFPSVWRSTSGPFGGFGSVTGPANGIISGDRSNWVTPYMLDPVTPNVMWLGTHRAYRSINNGSNWTQLGPDLTGNSGSLKVVEINRNYPDHVYTGSASGRIWRTPDDGNSWENITSGLPSRAINDIATDPANPDRVFATVGGFNTAHLWEWNAGSGWVARDNGLPNVPANTVVMLSSIDILVGNDVGVYRSVDSGLTFEPYMAGLPLGMVVSDLKFNADQNVITAGTYARGAWQVSVGAVGPILIFDSVEQPLTEIDGDGDMAVEPGETWAARVNLRNGGGQDANDAVAKLTSIHPGVDILNEGTLEYPSTITGGEVVTSTNMAQFVVKQAADCELELSFDLTDITTSNAPLFHPGRTSILALELGDGYEPPAEVNLLDENFDSDPPEWTHDDVLAGVSPCAGIPNLDQWGTVQKEAPRGLSYHSGSGPGTVHGKRVFGWLYHNGTDSTGGPGIVIPADVVGATLNVTHWYDTKVGQDGGQVVIDGSVNGQDTYTTLVPTGGYPTGTLGPNNCNGLQGQASFHGDSAGWVTSQFDLLPYSGTTVHLAFVFASGVAATDGEGWYIDGVELDVLEQGDRICEIQEWPGSIPDSLILERQGNGTMMATWDDACNLAILPFQDYSVQVGDLDQLRSTGVYNHAPYNGQCDLASPSILTEDSGNLYYLAISNESSRDGSSGKDSTGALRPAGGGGCGIQRDGSCSP